MESISSLDLLSVGCILFGIKLRLPGCEQVHKIWIRMILRIGGVDVGEVSLIGCFNDLNQGVRYFLFLLLIAGARSELAFQAAVVHGVLILAVQILAEYLPPFFCRVLY